MNIHPTALVDSGAELGFNVSVGPFSVVSGNVRIGDNSVLGQHVIIHPFTTIGPDCFIHANAVLGGLPQDLAFQNVESYVRIGAKCVIREGVTIHRGTKAETATVVGDGCFLMVNSHLAHNVKLGVRVIVANGALLAGYVEVGDMAFISGNVVIHQFVKIGRLAMLGGGCAIGKDVPPYCMTRPGGVNDVIGLNVVGMRRAGMDAGQRLEIKRLFNLLYRSGLNISEAADKMGREYSSESAAEFRRFIEHSDRGICWSSTRGNREGDQSS